LFNLCFIIANLSLCIKIILTVKLADKKQTRGKEMVSLRPKFLLTWGETLLPWWIGSGIIFGCTGLLLGLFFSPPDYQQGETVRIMYVHVPASWGALGAYTTMALFSAGGLITRSPLMHLITKSIAPIGITFTLISLGTGSIWGKPTWGTWWVWDARLTSMLLLLFLYLGYWAFITSGEEEEKSLTAGAVLTVIGCINIPIIKGSVTWWHTLHQPASVFRFAKPAIHWTMLIPLLCMALAFAAYGLVLTFIRLRTELNQRKIRSLHRREEFSLKEAA
jgi:heme exporter protein C